MTSAPSIGWALFRNGDFRLFGAPAVVAGGLATLLVAALWGWLFPALKARDRLMVGS